MCTDIQRSFFYMLHVTTAFRHALRGWRYGDAIFLETPASPLQEGAASRFAYNRADNSSHSPSVELRLADVVSVLSVYSGCGNSL